MFKRTLNKRKKFLQFQCMSVFLYCAIFAVLFIGFWKVFRALFVCYIPYKWFYEQNQCWLLDFLWFYLCVSILASSAKKIPILKHKMTLNQYNSGIAYWLYFAKCTYLRYILYNFAGFPWFNRLIAMFFSYCEFKKNYYHCLRKCNVSNWIINSISIRNRYTKKNDSKKPRSNENFWIIYLLTTITIFN